MRMLTALVALGIFDVGALTAQTVTAFKSGEESTGSSKHCFYRAPGGRYTLTIGADDVCPQSMQVQAMPTSDAEAPQYDRFNPPPGCTQSQVLMGTCHPDPAANQAPARSAAASQPAPASPPAPTPPAPAKAAAPPAGPKPLPAQPRVAPSPPPAPASRDTTLIAPPQHSAAFERKGFYIGVGLGYGGLTCDGCGSRESGVSGFFHLGGAVNSQVLLGVETNGWYKSVSGGSVTMGNLSFTVTGYPSKTANFFIKAGIGASVLSVDSFLGTDSETGFGASGGLGFDLPIGAHTALTPFGNWFFGSFTDGGANTIQFGLAINAY